MNGFVTMRMSDNAEDPSFEIESELGNADLFDRAMILYSLAYSMIPDPKIRKIVFSILSSGMFDKIDRTAIDMEVPE